MLEAQKMLARSSSRFLNESTTWEKQDKILAERIKERESACEKVCVCERERETDDKGVLTLETKISKVLLQLFLVSIIILSLDNFSLKI